MSGPSSSLLRFLRTLAVALVATSFLTSCYIFNFFKKKPGGDDSDDDVFTGAVIGQPLGAKAGGPNEALLAELYAVGTSHPPAALRPDPDLVVRRLLRQYRPEGATVARTIGEVEQYRGLLGGATTDFSKMPQESYDATSLLAVYKVSEEVCRGLVAPNQWEHKDWSTILPYPADQTENNVLWLAQRITGRPSAEISQAKLQALVAIMASEEADIKQEWWAYNNPYVVYIPVCAALALDADALYL